MNASQKSAVSPDALERLVSRLDGLDPFEVQEELLPSLRAAVATLSDDALRAPEAAGKWSVVEVVQHLADAELAYGFRIRMILAQDTPPLQGFDQDLWAQELGYRDTGIEHALEQLSALRAANLRLLRRLDDRQLDRVGIHSEAGPISVRMILYLLAGHDLTHLHQIERIKQAVGAA